VRDPLPPASVLTDEVARFLHESPPLPDWADQAALARTEKLFFELGPQILWSIGCLTFPASYAGARPVRVLALTARLVTDTHRRIAETLQMVLDCFQSDGLQPGHRGYATIRRVRLMHAGVRYLIEHDPNVTQSVPPKWDPSWGVPINQEELLGFLMPMTVTVLDGLDAMGVRLSAQQQEDWVHSWCVIGSLMGVRDDLVPVDLASARAFFAQLKTRYYASSDDGKVMMAAHLAMLRGLMPRFVGGMPASFIRYAMRDETPNPADLLDVPARNWTAVIFEPLRWLARTDWAADRHSRLLAWVARGMGAAMLDGFVHLDRGGERPDYDIPDSLADNWNVQDPVRSPGSVPARRR
jgi:hypothetical protein